MLIVLFAVLAIILFWITCFVFVNDFSVPTRNTNALRKVLVIFPHSDDEINCGGLIHHLSTQKKEVTLVVLTKGERGTPHATLDLRLKEIRPKEVQSVAALFGCKLVQEDFGDGELRNKKPELTLFVRNILEQENPDCIITYDLAGLYGHEDHITCSEIVTELQKKKFQKIVLWYIAYPKRVLSMAKLPEHMAKDPHFKNKRAVPTQKVFIGLSMFPKIKSFYAYKSQNPYARGIRRLIPIWVLFTLFPFEYFAEVGQW